MACHTGPGFCSPMEAMKAEREKLVYVTCISANWKLNDQPDFLATVDVDPRSPTYSKVIHRLHVPYKGDELHHTGWNACSSCQDNSVKRNFFIMPGINSDRIYIVDVSNPTTPSLFKVVETSEIHEVANASAPHTVHCLPNGDIMVSCLGDAEGNAKGTFVLLEQGTFRVKSKWGSESAKYNYDFWYQPRHDIMVSTEWSAPKVFRQGFSVQDFKNGLYGHSINFWNWSERKLINSLDLGTEGQIPLEVRFLHNPDASEGFVGCALSSTVFRFFKTEEGIWDAQKVIEVPQKKVRNWYMDIMPGLITDILISLDDRFLYISNWLQGDIRQYDISDTKHPRLVGQIFLGGSLCKDSKVRIEGETFDKQPDRPSVKGIPFRGGPQMLQLSLDGKRLYVTTSLFSAWDAQFYPDNLQNGSLMVCVNVDTACGGLSLDPNFLVDFGQFPEGPVLAHEMRFPDGDSTSDIWI